MTFPGQPITAFTLLNLTKNAASSRDCNGFPTNKAGVLQNHEMVPQLLFVSLFDLKPIRVCNTGWSGLEGEKHLSHKIFVSLHRSYSQIPGRAVGRPGVGVAARGGYAGMPQRRLNEMDRRAAVEAVRGVRVPEPMG